jgi:serine/threonine protein kinase
MKAKKRSTGVLYAIKQIKNQFNHPYSTRQLYREIKIMRKLSEVKSNVFTPILHDILLPTACYEVDDQSNSPDAVDDQQNTKSSSQENLQKGSDKDRCTSPSKKLRKTVEISVML